MQPLGQLDLSQTIANLVIDKIVRYKGLLPGAAVQYANTELGDEQKVYVSELRDAADKIANDESAKKAFGIKADTWFDLLWTQFAPQTVPIAICPPGYVVDSVKRVCIKPSPEIPPEPPIQPPVEPPPEPPAHPPPPAETGSKAYLYLGLGAALLLFLFWKD